MKRSIRPSKRPSKRETTGAQQPRTTKAGKARLKKLNDKLVSVLATPTKVKAPPRKKAVEAWEHRLARGLKAEEARVKATVEPAPAELVPVTAPPPVLQDLASFDKVARVYWPEPVPSGCCLYCGRRIIKDSAAVAVEGHSGQAHAACHKLPPTAGTVARVAKAWTEFNAMTPDAGSEAGGR